MKGMCKHTAADCPFYHLEQDVVNQIIKKEVERNRTAAMADKIE